MKSKESLEKDFGGLGRKGLRNYPPIHQMIIKTRTAILAGIGAMGVGGYVLLIWAGVVGGKVSVPLWVMGVVGASIILVGLASLMHGLDENKREGMLRQARDENPGEPWRGDFDWSQASSRPGMTHRNVSERWRLMFFILIMICFASIAHGIAHQDSSALILMMAIGCDLLIVLLSVVAVKSFLIRRRYGIVRLVFDQVPVHPGGTLEARVICPKGFKGYEQLSVTLRYIVEHVEGRGPTTRHVKKQVLALYEEYRDDYVIEEIGGQYSEGGEFPILFDIPENAPCSEMAEFPAKFWDIEIRRKAKGVDLVHRFAVPVYRADDELG